jgi:raffinose/stachyose/melibiose transport system permease protein
MLKNNHKIKEGDGALHMWRKLFKRSYFEGFIFVLPAFIIYFFVVLKPLVFTAWLSLFQWDGASEKTFVALANFSKLFRDSIFFTSLRNNVAWIIASIFIPMLIGLLLAVLLSGIRSAKLRVFCQTTYFMPVIPSLVIVGIIWGWIYNPIFGAINKFLELVGLSFLKRGWLGDPKWALPSVILAGNWTYFGFCMTIFLAGLQNISRDLYEAAIIDGASRFQCFRHITVPGLKNQINLLIVYSLIGSFKVFDIVYIMTKGGPSHATEVIGTYMYTRAFEQSMVGYGSSMAVVLTIIVLSGSMLFLKLRERSD